MFFRPKSKLFRFKPGKRKIIVEQVVRHLALQFQKIVKKVVKIGIKLFRKYTVLNLKEIY